MHFIFPFDLLAARAPSAPKSSGTALIPEENQLPGGGKQSDRTCLAVEFDGPTAVSNHRVDALRKPCSNAVVLSIGLLACSRYLYGSLVRRNLDTAMHLLAAQRLLYSYHILSLFVDGSPPHFDNFKVAAFCDVSGARTQLLDHGPLEETQLKASVGIPAPSGGLVATWVDKKLPWERRSALPGGVVVGAKGVGDAVKAEGEGNVAVLEHFARLLGRDASEPGARMHAQRHGELLFCRYSRHHAINRDLFSVITRPEFFFFHSHASPNSPS